MNSAALNFVQAAGKSKFTLVAAVVVLIYSLLFSFLKKEKVGMRLVGVLAFISLAVFLIARLFPVPISPEPPQRVGGDVTIQGDGNATANGNGNSVHVDNDAEQKEGRKRK